MAFLLSYTQYLIKDINSLHIIQCKMQLVTFVFPFLFLNISHWNVAGVLCAVIYVSLTDLLVGKKGRRHYRHWMNSLIQKEQFLSCKLASSWAQTGLSCEQRGAGSGGILVGISLSIQKLMQFCLFFDCFGFPTVWWGQLTVFSADESSSSGQHLVHSK